jgi:hypothetical protein
MVGDDVNGDDAGNDNSTADVIMLMQLDRGRVTVRIVDDQIYSNTSTPSSIVEVKWKGRRLDDNKWHTVALRRLKQDEMVSYQYIDICSCISAVSRERI